jgi:hypothetical protein
MNGRNIVLGAVALGLVALIIVFFASAGDTGGDVAPHSPPAVGAAEDGATTAPAATDGEAPAPAVSRSAARSQKSAASGAAESKIELAPDAKPSDGGLAFGSALCEKMSSCNCQDRAMDSCARGWVSIKPEEWDTVKCMLDLSCEDVCRIYDHPKDVACLVQVDEMLTKRFVDRKIE